MGTVAPLLIAGHWQAAQDSTGSFRAFDPASGDAIGPAFPRSGAADVEQALAAASAAAPQLATADPERIAAFLDASATALEADADTLVQLAHAETGLPATPRLRGNAGSSSSCTVMGSDCAVPCRISPVTVLYPSGSCEIF